MAEARNSIEEFRLKYKLPEPRTRGRGMTRSTSKMQEKHVGEDVTIGVVHHKTIERQDPVSNGSETARLYPGRSREECRRPDDL
jgi:hypothetical protein